MLCVNIILRMIMLSDLRFEACNGPLVLIIYDQLSCPALMQFLYMTAHSNASQHICPDMELMRHLLKVLPWPVSKS
jgi:hypothetical protein